MATHRWEVEVLAAVVLGSTGKVSFTSLVTTVLELEARRSAFTTITPTTGEGGGVVRFSGGILQRSGERVGKGDGGQGGGGGIRN